MSRQSISFTDPNSEWLKTKIEVEGEYKSNSEVVNELIRRERARERSEIAAIRLALQEGENSGLSEKSPDDIIQSVLQRKITA
ncbi:MAG: ribbon-helix-helix domain-containing protein [Terasakiella sp.]|uniref:ribbon-helix-helix domain-containing protein n=1 Tax=unclassified Terasakiella TaxID=2614952 RepID=UPI003B009797